MKKWQLEIDIKDIEKRLKKLECPHLLQMREFQSSDGFIYREGGVQRCSACHGAVDIYDTDIEYKEAKLKWHKEMGSSLEVQDDNKE